MYRYQFVLAAHRRLTAAEQDEIVEKLREAILREDLDDTDLPTVLIEAETDVELLELDQ